MLTLGWLNHPWLPGLLPDLRWRSYYWRVKDIKQPDDRQVYSKEDSGDNSGNLWLEICWMIRHTDLSLMPENQDPMLIVATPSLSLDALNNIVKSPPPISLPHVEKRDLRSSPKNVRLQHNVVQSGVWGQNLNPATWQTLKSEQILQIDFCWFFPQHANVIVVHTILRKIP